MIRWLVLAFVAWATISWSLKAQDVTATGFHVTGRLVDDASDLQVGYFSVCGTGTGQCKATDAIGISVHPNNALLLAPLQSMVGHDVIISIVPR